MKKLFVILSLLIFLSAGITAAVFIAREVPLTYDGTETDVYELMQDYAQREDDERPEDAESDERSLPEEADGIASIIITTNLSETQSTNDVASIVFDYRGYDTMGESFILLTAIAGSYIILKDVKGREEAPDEEE